MTTHDGPVALEELLAHREWVRGLARAIARDEHEAGDVEQATWVAALETPPAHRGSLRGWLGTTARNALRRIRRSERRRAAREAAAPARRDADDAADLAARADAHRAVVEALVAQEEPYRRTLLLRYFEGLPVAEVAARTGVPLETCRARLRRGVERLRGRFREREGGLAVVLLACGGRESGEGSAAAVAGGAVMGAKTWAALAAILVLAGSGGWWMTRATPPGPAAPVDTAAAPPEAPSRVARPAPPANAPRARAEPAPPPSPVPAAVPVPDVQPTVKERLAKTMSVTWEQMPLELALAHVSDACGVDVYLAKGLLDGRSAAESAVASLQMENVACGQMVSVLAMISGLASAEQEDRVVVHAQGAAVPAVADQVRVRRLADFPQAVVTFRVVAPDGASVAGAEILRTGGTVFATADATGAAQVRQAPPFPRVLARAPGWTDAAPVQPTADPAAPSECRIVLGGPAGTLAGSVRTEDGRPASDVIVVTAPVGPKGDDLPRHHTLRTDALGAFVDRSCDPGTVSVRAQARGHGPSRVTAVVAAGSETRVEVTLPREAVVEGVLRTEDGAPVQGVVQVTAEGFGPLRGADADAEGRFRIDGLPAGRVTLTASAFRAAGRPCATATIEVSGGSTTRWDPTLAPRKR